MTKQAIVLVLLSAALAASSGCGVCRSVVCDPFGCGPECVGPRCGPVFGAPCGPLRGRWGPRAVLAEPCDDDGCGECGLPPYRCRCRFIRGPLSFVFALFTAGSYRGCWGGCGERYWGDWYGDPPACSDPCDCHGNFIGGDGDISGMTGGPFDDTAMPAQPGGCRSCGSGGHASHTRAAPRYPAAYPAGTQHYAAQPSNAGQRAPSGYASRGQRYPARYSSAPNSSGSYAPRLISTTDRVVKPATPDQGPRLAQPQRSDVVQE